ncbi:MAG: hypothetical protein HY909_18355 [Deltaproteobacteria bacterium]|nr:hypothetical protein [Deltaproteobacteria bacterium]
MDDDVIRGRALERALVGLFLVGALGAVVTFGRFALAVPLSEEDWTWLDHGRSAGALWSVARTSHRPVPDGLLALNGALLGARAGALAAVFLGAHLAAAYGAARWVRSLGLGLPAGVLVALFTLLDPVSADSLGYFSRGHVVVSRAFFFAALAALLGPAPPRARRWLPWALLGLLSHEQAALLAPLWSLSVAFRDGWRSALGALRTRAGLAVWGLCALYVALWFLGRADAAVLRDASGAGSLGDRWAHFAQSVVDFFGFHTGLGFREELLPAVGYFAPRWWTARALVALVGASAVGLWLRRETRQALRILGFSALWTLAASGSYLLYLGAREPYHFNVSLVGLALPGACALVHLWRRCEGRWRPLRVFVALFCAVTALPLGRVYLRRDRPDPSRELQGLLAPRLRPERDAVTHLVFLDDVSPRPWHDAPVYLSALGGTWDCNDPEPPESLNLALLTLFPSRHFRVWALTPAHSPYLCLRPGDVALEVSVRSLEAQTYAFRPLPPCDRPGGVPLALDPSTPEGVAVAARLGPRGAPALRAARSFWAAYHRADRGAQLGQVARLREAAAPLLGDATTREEARRVLDAALAAAPVLFWPRDPRYPRGLLRR